MVETIEVSIVIFWAFELSEIHWISPPLPLGFITRYIGPYPQSGICTNDGTLYVLSEFQHAADSTFRSSDPGVVVFQLSGFRFHLTPSNGREGHRAKKDTRVSAVQNTFHGRIISHPNRKKSVKSRNRKPENSAQLC